MAATRMTLDGKRFVVLPEHEYLKLKAGAKRDGSSARSPARPRRLTAQDRGDIAESKRRLADPQRVPAAELFRKLGV